MPCGGRKRVSTYSSLCNFIFISILVIEPILISVYASTPPCKHPQDGASGGGGRGVVWGRMQPCNGPLQRVEAEMSTRYNWLDKGSRRTLLSTPILLYRANIMHVLLQKFTPDTQEQLRSRVITIGIAFFITLGMN